MNQYIQYFTEQLKNMDQYIQYFTEQLKKKRKAIDNALKLASKSEQAGNNDRAERMLEMAMRFENEIEEIKKKIKDVK